MGDKSSISWTNATWNPVTGCSKVSPGCANCYAETLATTRLVGKDGYTGLPWTPENAAVNVVLRPERLGLPLRWQKPRMIFVNSMSDLFHEQVPDDFILKAFDVMNRATWRGGAGIGRIRDETREGHVFQVLTKRPERMAEFVNRLTFDPVVGLALDGPGGVFANPDIWLGTSVENARWRTRLDALRSITVPMVTRFVSFEPLLGPLACPTCNGVGWMVETHGRTSCCGNTYPDGECRGYCVIEEPEAVQVDCPSVPGWSGAHELDLTGIKWAIVGAESGPGRRPYDMAWARDIRKACVEQGTAFFYKQSGAHKSGYHPYLTEEDGTCWEWHQYPGDLADPVFAHDVTGCPEAGQRQEMLAL